ncbi:MAG TPA: hypothetical protein VF441_10575 [Acidimicrobiia bacterium]
MDEVTQSYAPRDEPGGPGDSGDDSGDGPGGGGGDGQGDDDGGKDRRKLWWILGGVLAAGLIVGIVIALATSDSGSNKTATTASSSTTTSSTTTSTTGPSTTTSSSTTSTTAQPAKPIINSFTVPNSVNCPSNSGSVMINVAWGTSNSTSVTLSIDGPVIYKSYPGSTGSDSVPFACSNASNSYLLTAKGPGGDATSTITANRGP